MYRSEHILKGLSNQYYRATYKSMGFTTEDLKRPSSASPTRGANAFPVTITCVRSPSG